LPRQDQADPPPGFQRAAPRYLTARPFWSMKKSKAISEGKLKRASFIYYEAEKPLFVERAQALAEQAQSQVKYFLHEKKPGFIDH
jgi:hypothetical protein